MAGEQDALVMNRSERLAWLIVIGLGCFSLFSRFMAHQEHVAEREEAGRRLTACGSQLDECESLCTDIALTRYERADQIFECEQSICAANGWLSPDDWAEYEAATEYEARHDDR